MGELKFRRSEGFVGSIPTLWIDKNLPICPFCNKSGPKWEQAREGRLRLSLYHFRCPTCHGEISIPIVVVNDGGMSLGPNLMNAITARLFRIESIGTSESALKVGRMMSPEEMRKLSVDDHIYSKPEESTPRVPGTSEHVFPTNAIEVLRSKFGALVWK